MDILIIGGSGHVSGTLAEKALAAGHAVWTITKGITPIPKGVTSLIADRLIDEDLTNAVVSQNMRWDLVVDCIGYHPEALRQDIPLFRERADHFVFISTDFVYDPVQRVFPQPEDSPYATDDDLQFYGCEKRRCELELINGDTGNMAWTVLRPGHIYGPKSELGCSYNHVRDPELIAKLRAGTPLQLVGGGYFLLQPLLADDLALTILSAAGNKKADKAICNIGGPDLIEARRYYKIIAEILNVGLTIEELPVDTFLANNPAAITALCTRYDDLTRLKDCGLHMPSTPIEEGLRYHVEGLLARKGM